MYVIDASVIVKWYVEEEESDKALKILEDYEAKTSEIALPDLAVYEVANVLRYNFQFTPKDAKKSLWALSKLNLDLITPISTIVQPAMDLAFEKNISLYDAIYIALSKEIGYEFVTADEKLYEKVKDLGFVKLLSDFEISPK